MSNTNTEEKQSIYLGKTIIREGTGDNFAMLTKSTLTLENATLLIESLTEIINAAESDEEKIHLTSFLKVSQYDNNSYFGNMKAELVVKMENNQKAGKKYTPKKSGVSESQKDRINNFKQG